MSFLETPRPSFFVVGAPKCGTTALGAYLARHPNVFFSDPKEPEYFNTDHAPEFRFATTEETYESCFEGVTEEHVAIGEGSVWYLHSKVAVENILKFNPDARFVVMIRNPVEMVHSLHSELMFTDDEDQEDFEAAWRLNQDRREGNHLPRHCREPMAVEYDEVGKLGRDLERLFSQVPEDRVHVVNFDDFKTDTDLVYGKVLDFIGAPAASLSEYPVVNGSKRVSSPTVRRALHVATNVKRKLGFEKSFGIGRKLILMNSTPAKRTDLSEQFKKELADHFREDVKLLGELTHRDLSHWVNR